MPEDMENYSMEVGGSPAEGNSPQPPTPLLKPREIWRLSDLLLFVVFGLVAYLMLGLLASTAFAVARPFLGWHASTDWLAKNPIFGLILQSTLYVSILGFLFLLARLHHQQPFWKSLGWHNPTPKQVASYLGGGGMLAVAVSVALSLRPDLQGFPLEKLFNSRAACFAIGAFAISLAPLVEEVVFRGLLFAIFEGAMGLRFAVVATAILFAGLHVPEYWHAWNHLFMILVVGMVFSMARGTTGSIAPSIMLHIGYNSLIMTGFFFSTQHFRAGSGF
jgi:hypothetical protein